MKKLWLIELCLLAAGAVSCSKLVEGGPGEREALTVLPYSAQTKSAVSGGSLPDDYTIYLSSYFNNATGGEFSGNYFTGVPFRRSGDAWSASPVIYWPLGGNLDFLAAAARDIDIREVSHWYEDNVTRSVEIQVPDGKCLNSEIMYACATSKKSTDGTVGLNFFHSQSWLQFEVASYLPNTTMIDSIVVNKAYLGGTLKIENGVFLDTEWDYHGRFKTDYTIPQSRGVVLDETVKTFHLLLPEQDACDITIWFRQKDEQEPSWDNYTRRTSYTVKANPDPWFAGIKTIYNMIILKQVSVQVSVHDWEDSDKTVIIK
ncbi:MAG: fimbrillin family protein [Bacteroidales bacterium]|nr:fimbrillin family protein [Candidatus Cacconaster merdequi]